MRYARYPKTVIATLPGYAAHRAEIVAHPLVDELRYNTVTAVGVSRKEQLKRIKDECGAKRLWIDLKGRQLRIAKFALLPYAAVELNHEIICDLPAEILFKDCSAKIIDIVRGRRLILEERPGQMVGEGEAVNILHPSLRIVGTLTKGDRAYVAAARKLGLHDYMLSFVEESDDVGELIALDPAANIVAKIESRRGLRFVQESYPMWSNRVRLMAARDDLFINMGERKEDYLPAVELIAEADPEAIVASRLLTSLEAQEQVAAQDLGDLELMLRLGYKTIMLSDGLCFRDRGRAFRSAMEVLTNLRESWKRRRP